MSTLQSAIVWLEKRIPGVADHSDAVDAINLALSDIGFVTQVNETLTVVNNQTEYTLPAGVSNVVRVQVASSSSADYDYETQFNWHEINGKLYLPDSLKYTAGGKIRIYYNAPHSEVTTDASTISDAIPMPMLATMAAYYYEYLQFYSQANMGAKDTTILDRLLSDKLLAQQRYSVTRMHRDPILGSE
jgi:hypothetical protein